MAMKTVLKVITVRALPDVPHHTTSLIDLHYLPGKPEMLSNTTFKI